MMTMLCPSCWGVDGPCLYCRGSRVAPDESLSAHFLFSEMVQSPYATRLRVRNDPSPEVVANLRELCAGALEPLRAAVGPLHVTSGYRSLELNARVAGASTTSAHPEGNAADLVPYRSSVKAAVLWLINSPLAYDQVIYEGTWVHVGWRKSGIMPPRRQALMMFGGKYSAFDPADPRVR